MSVVHAEEQVSAPPAAFVSLNELEQICQQDPAEYVIEGLLPANDVHVAVGDSGLGKTPWAYQMGLCVSTGRPFLGYPTRAGRVLYLDLENGPQSVLDVARTLCAHLGIERFPNEFLVPRDETVHELSDIVPAFSPTLVIVDTLRAYNPRAEMANDEMGQLLGNLRSLARSQHCTILLLHHIRKPGENGVPALEDTPPLVWLLQASGARALINQTNTRIALDYKRGAGGGALIMRSFVKLKGDSGPVHIERACDSEEEPVGYRRLADASLLRNEDQEDAYERLPEHFRFKEAMAVYARSDDPTTKWLRKCISLGILAQTNRGEYRKVETDREHRVRREPARAFETRAVEAEPAALASLSTVER
jgi:hypothetical protein